MKSQSSNSLTFKIKQLFRQMNLLMILFLRLDQQLALDLMSRHRKKLLFMRIRDGEAVTVDRSRNNQLTQISTQDQTSLMQIYHQDLR
jgi:hypothetical protein